MKRLGLFVFAFTAGTIFSANSHAMMKCAGMSDCPRMYDCFWGYCCKIKASGGGYSENAVRNGPPGNVDLSGLPADLQQLLQKDSGVLAKFPRTGPAPSVQAVKSQPVQSKAVVAPAVEK